MNAVHVADIGVTTALGPGADALWEALLAGRTGLAPVRRFATDSYLSNLAGCIPDLDAQRPGSRLDALVQMLFGESLAIPADTVLITASTKAGIDQLETSIRTQPTSCAATFRGIGTALGGGSLKSFGLGDGQTYTDACSRPTIPKAGGFEAATRPPRNVVAHATSLDRILGCQVADFVAGRLGLKGPRFNISAACASSTIALALAAARIEAGEADSVLVCGLDLVSEFVFSGFSALHALSSTACRPFDTGRDGLLLGEGAAYLLLMSEHRCRQARRDSLGRIVGWGIASDAHHITAPSRTGEGLILAVRQALDHAGLAPADIAAVNAHGTGSVYNDAMELTAFASLFDPLPPLHSIKGAIGHTMGACGAIEAIVGLRSLERQCLPPTIGLRTPEPAGLGRISPQAQQISGDYLLTTNSGFGGINACLVLQKGGL